jgi:hypothetical protein
VTLASANASLIRWTAVVRSVPSSRMTLTVLPPVMIVKVFGLPAGGE